MANTIKFKRASGSDPTASDLAIGEPGLRTDTAELFFKKDNGTIAKVSGGGGGPDFKYLELRNAANNGAASFPGNDFTLVLAGTTTAISPAAANTLLVSVSGVVQKPNAGTSTSGITGFIVDGSRFKTATNLPAAPDFIVYQESGGIGEPSDNTVTSAKIVDGTIVNADINASAAIDGSKINPTFSSGQTITLNSDRTNPVLKVQGGGPNFITFASNSSGTVDSDSINLVYRTTPNTLAFERASDDAVLFSVDADNGALFATGQAFVGQRDNATTFGFGFSSVHQRGTISSPSVSNSGDSIFTLVGQLYDSGAYRDSCRIHYEVDGTPSSGSAPGRIVFKTTPSSSGTSAERMRIDSSGDVGIGTSSPSVKLDVAGALKVSGNVTIDAFSNPTTTTLSLRSGVNATQTGGMGLAAKDHSGANADGLAVYGHDGISFHTSQAERIRINSGGKLFVGMSSALISSPNNPRMQVFQQMGIRAETNANSSTALVFQNPAGRQGFINTNASGITINGTSDYRVKDNINYSIDGISLIKQIKPCTFQFKADSDNNTVHGFIAHELQAVLPEAVTGEKDEVVTQAKIDAGEYDQETLGDEIHQGVDASKLIPLLTKALQEAIVRIEALEAK